MFIANIHKEEHHKLMSIYILDINQEYAKYSIKKREYALLCTQTIVYLHHQIRLIGYIKGIKIKRT